MGYANDADIADSQGFLIKIAFDPSDPTVYPVTVSDLDFRDALGAVQYDLKGRRGLSRGLTVTRCAGSGLYYGIQIVGGSTVKYDKRDIGIATGFTGAELSYNTWSNLGNAWIIGAGSTFTCSIILSTSCA